MTTDRLININEVCEFLAISKSTVYNLISQHKLAKPLKIGHSSRWRLSELDALVAQIEAEQLHPPTVGRISPDSMATSRTVTQSRRQRVIVSKTANNFYKSKGEQNA